MIAVGVQNPDSIVQPTVKTDLVTGFTSAANIAFSYGKDSSLRSFPLRLKKSILTMPSQP